MISRVLSLLLLLGCSAATAQNGKGFESLQANSSPAYVVLGVDPENISRPNSPRDFVAGAQSAIVDGRLQPNFALETSPYYWAHPKKHPARFSAVDFVTNNRWGLNVLRSLTFSFATSATDTLTYGALTQGTGIGAGAHLQLLSGRISHKSRDRISRLLTSFNTRVLLEHLAASVDGGRSIEDVATELRRYIDRTGGDYQQIVTNLNAIPQVLALLKGKTSLGAEDMPMLDDLIGSEDARAKNAQREVLEIRAPLSREGFMLELSSATGVVAGDNRWDRVNYGKTAVWLTPSYRFNVNADPAMIDYVDIMAVARVVFNNPEVDASDYVDGGIRFQWIHNRIAVSGEGVFRYATQTPVGLRRNYTYRAALSLGYKVNDNITFKATAGTNFDGNTATYSDPKKMFAVGGFNFGFGDLFR